MAWWKKLGYNFADKTNDLQAKIISGDGNGVRLELKTNGSSLPILFSIDKPLSSSSDKYSSPILVMKDAQIIAAAFNDKKPSGKIDTFKFIMHEAAGKKITLTHQPASKYSADGNGSIINGIMGSDKKYGKEWLGFEGKDFEAIIDLGEIASVDEINLRFFNAPSQWIYPPKYVAIYLSQNGINYNELPSFVIQPSKELVINYFQPAASTKAKFIKIVAKNYGTIPDGQEGAGHGAWLFIDEIVVK
jgi:hexosaminidase